MWETRLQSLGREDPLEKEMAAHSSTLAWKIPWTEEPGRLQSMGSQRVRHDWATTCLMVVTVVFIAPDPAAGTVNPHLCQRFLYTHRQVWLSLLWGHCSFLLGPGVHKVLLVPSKSLFPQTWGNSVIKSHWPPKSNSRGVLSPFAGSPGWEICCGS